MISVWILVDLTERDSTLILLGRALRVEVAESYLGNLLALQRFQVLKYVTDEIERAKFLKGPNR